MKLTKQNFPGIIKQIRRDNKWTTADLGKILGVSARTVEAWEQGRRVPTSLELVNFFVGEAKRGKENKTNRT